MKRRNFVKLCGSALTLAAANPMLTARADDAKPKAYDRARLVDKHGKPIKASKLKVGENYLFHYPYAGTPAFLLRLPKAAPGGDKLETAVGGQYTWPGGVGPDKTVVSYCAICAHQLSYPSKQHSFINYTENKSPVAGRGNVIVCCAHHSVYDPAHGAKVVGGPAPQPLAAITLEYDKASDGLYATGTFGGEVYGEYFKAYRHELIEEFGRGVAKDEINKTAMVMPLSEYVKQRFTC